MSPVPVPMSKTTDVTPRETTSDRLIGNQMVLRGEVGSVDCERWVTDVREDSRSTREHREGRATRGERRGGGAGEETGSDPTFRKTMVSGALGKAGTRPRPPTGIFGTGLLLGLCFVNGITHTTPTHEQEKTVLRSR